VTFVFKIVYVRVSLLCRYSRWSKLSAGMLFKPLNEWLCFSAKIFTPLHAGPFCLHQVQYFTFVCTDLHTAQSVALPLTASCFCKIQIGFAFLVLAHLGSREIRAVKRVHVHVTCGSWPWLTSHLVAFRHCTTHYVIQGRIKVVGGPTPKPVGAGAPYDTLMFVRIVKCQSHIQYRLVAWRSG